MFIFGRSRTCYFPILLIYYNIHWFSKLNQQSKPKLPHKKQMIIYIQKLGKTIFRFSRDQKSFLEANIILFILYLVHINADKIFIFIIEYIKLKKRHMMRYLSLLSDPCWSFSLLTFSSSLYFVYFSMLGFWQFTSFVIGFALLVEGWEMGVVFSWYDVHLWSSFFLYFLPSFHLSFA